MRYTQFRFENFKGIESMTLPLRGDVTTLIGLNESGKTTILEAISCFSYGKEDLGALNPGLESLRDPEQWIPIADRANFNQSIVIEATVSLDADDKAAYSAHMSNSHRLKVADVPDEITIEERYGFTDSRHMGTERLWHIKLKGRTGKQRTDREFEGMSSPEWVGATDWIEERLPRILYFPNFLFDIPDRFKLTDDGQIVTQEERDRTNIYRSTVEQILSVFDRTASLTTHIVKRLGSTDKADQRALEAALLGMGRVLSKTVFAAWYRTLGRAPAAQEVEFIPDPDDGTVALRLKGPDGYYNLAERSLGFRWFFMFLMMTSFYKTSQAGQRSLFLLDEPASNLHSSAQAALLKSFEDLLDRCSLVYTTHSHHLINVRWLDSAFVVKNEALGTLDFADYLAMPMDVRTSISATPYRRFVVDHPMQTSYFQPVLDLLDYRPSFLEPVPTVVLVEGKSDFYLLRYAQEVLGLMPELHLVPGTGAGSLEPVIQLQIGWGKPFVVLLDGDNEGKKQKARYEREFGSVLRGRCHLLPSLVGDSSCKEAEDLLAVPDIERLVGEVYATGTPQPRGKKALRTAVMELFAARKAVTFEPATVARFRTLVDALNLALEEQE